MAAELGSIGGAEQTLFVAKHGRLAFLRRFPAWLLARLLRQSNLKHLAERRRPLVVFSFDHIAHSIHVDGVYERDELEVFFAWMKRAGIDFGGATALDIGANIGNHSLYFSDYFAHVVSFEPNPRTFRVLSINADLVGNVTCHNVGLSDRAGEATLSMDPANMGGASIGGAANLQAQTISLVDLDSLGDLGDVKLVKIDVEGHEYKALSGGRNLLTAKMPIILFEQHLKEFVNGQSPVVSLLREMGYERFAVIKKHPRITGGLLRKLFLVPALDLLVGDSTRVTLCETIKPDFYSFIVALPRWASSAATAR